MNKTVMILSAVSLIFFIQSVSANVLIGNFSVNTQYAPNATITGWVNLSLINVSSNAYITSNSGQNISLRSLLNQQTGFNYSCSTLDCNSSYTATDSGNLYENFSLIAGQPQIFGFLINGNAPLISGGNLLSLNVSSDAGMANAPQLSVDLLNDGFSEWNAYQASSTLGQQSFGCYSDSIRNSQPSYLGSTQYCEKIALPISAEVNIGAQVSGSGSSQFQMSIQNINGSSATGNCLVTATGSGQISCIAKNSGSSSNYLIKNSGNFWICIKQAVGTANSYQINSANPANPCGYVGNFAGNYTIDFQIFGQSVLFAPVGSFLFNDSEIANSGYPGNLEQEITNYLQSKYGDKCSSGCLIPIGFNAAQNQNINLSSLNLLIFDSSSGTTAINTLYKIAQTPALINTKGYQSLSLNSAGFSVPSNFGPYSLALNLIDGNTSYPLLSQTVSVAQIPQISSVTPLTTAQNLPTNFTAIVNTFGSNATISQYQWNFGDGSPIQTTSTNSISHTFNQIAVFNLQITISNSQGLNSMSNFSINSVSSKDAVNQVLSQDLQNLATLQNFAGNFSGFTQSAIKKLLNLDSISTQLQNLQIKNNSATSDTDYANIMKALLLINLTQNIRQSSSAVSVPFIPSGETINLDALERVGGSTYNSSRKSDYVNSILTWDLNNVSMTIDYTEFSAVNGASVTPIIDVFKLNFVGNHPENKVYLFIPALNQIYFDKNYTLLGSYYSVPLTGTAQTVQFATAQSYLPIDLPVFIAPSLDQVSIPEQSPPVNEASRMMIFGLILGGIVIVGIAAYILIGKWYQRKYESYLFKDRNDLYNIINYVHASKIKGLKEIEIERNLRKSKWTSEQISYVLKRYAGKKVGVPGFKKK